MIGGARVVAAIVVALTAAVSHADEIAVFAAGSLRAPLTDIARAFEQASGQTVALTFGASGLLRDRIAKGERADLFASANMEHPRSLAGSGWATRVQRFARNRMCLLASSAVGASTATALATMLDPDVKVGTSTPKADPSGDYAWKVFRRANAVKHGAYETLSSKALQLTGGPQSSAPPREGSVYAALVERGDVDVFLTYCTNAALAQKEAPALQVVRLPAALEVSADYGMAVRKGASAGARDLAAFILAQQGLQTLRAYGFDPP